MKSFISKVIAAALLLTSTAIAQQAIPGVLNGGAQQIGPSTFGVRGQNLSVDGKGNLIYQGETLGARLRRQAWHAKFNNPYLRPYQIRCPAWQRGTTYNLGQVIVNGGNLLVAAWAGTSSASGNGPTTTGTSAQTDGSTGWIYAGLNSVTSDPSTSDPAWAASTVYTAGQFATYGGRVYVCIVGGTSAASGGLSGTGVGISDNTAVWNYYGPLKQSPSIPDFCTYTASTVSPSLGHVYTPTPLSPMSAVSALVNAGGSGYAVGDTITLAGGTFSSAVVLKVLSVSSGAVQTVSVQTAGSYSVLPSQTVSQGSTSGTGTGATFYVRWPDPSWCRLRGCYNAGLTASAGFSLFTFQPAPNAYPTTQHWTMEFYSDAPRLSINIGPNSDFFNVIVNNDQLKIDGMQHLASSTYSTFDFSVTGRGRAVRRWKIEGCAGTPNIASIQVDSSSSLWRADDNDRTRAVIISDSIWAGSSYGPFLPGGSCAQLLSHELGWVDIWDYSQGGTGYVNRGSGPGTTSDKFGYRIAEASGLNPDIWLLMGSTNDSASYSSYQAAVSAVLTSIRAVSNAPIVVLGVWSINDTSYTSGQKIANFESLAQAAVAATGDPLIFFVPVRTDANGPWITGAWNNSTSGGWTDTSSTNASTYICSDNTHPVDLGTQYEARRIGQAIRQQVLPYIPRSVSREEVLFGRSRWHRSSHLEQDSMIRSLAL